MNDEDFKLSANGLDKKKREAAINKLIEKVESSKKSFLGYQNNFNLSYDSIIKKFLDLSLNNVGDPFKKGNLATNSKIMERAVLDYYAKLWHVKTPHNQNDPESYWGYVLTMGSTEGNLYGLWNGRDYLSGRKLIIDDSKSAIIRMRHLEALPVVENPNAYTPVAFFSEDTHYSIIKAMRILQIPTFYEIGRSLYPNQNPLHPNGLWTKEFSEVPSLNGKEGSGSIDVEKLAILVEFFASKGYPILICCNYGTTFKGAYDDVKAIGEKLMPVFKKYNLIDRRVNYDETGHSDIRNGYWIHVDGALGAAYMPFLEMAYERKEIEECGPIFDFRLPFVNSIVMSGHKWIGASNPCGIYMTKVKYQLFPPDHPEYIGSPDTTFAGSRNGLSPILLWDYLAQNSYDSQIKKAIKGDELAKYTLKKLNEAQIAHPELDLWIVKSPLSLTIRFRKPNDKIVKKHSLSCETFLINKERRHYAHIYLMDSVKKELIDEFVEELKNPDAFD